VVDLIGHYFHKTPYEIIQLNTDGIFVEIDKSEETLNKLKVVKNRWEQAFSKDNGIELELVEYKAFYQADVNNYFAVRFDGSIKPVGRFAPKTIVKKLNDAPVVFDAVIKYLLDGTPVEDTVAKAEYADYIFQKSASGGYEMNGEHIPYKHLRFVASTTGGDLSFIDKGGKKKFGGSKYNNLKVGIVYDLTTDVHPINKDFYENQAYYWIYKMLSGIKKANKTTVEYKTLIAGLQVRSK